MGKAPEVYKNLLKIIKLTNSECIGECIKDKDNLSPLFSREDESSKQIQQEQRSHQRNKNVAWQMQKLARMKAKQPQKIVASAQQEGMQKSPMCIKTKKPQQKTQAAVHIQFT